MKITIEKSKKGQKTLVCEAFGKRHLIYSRYNPKKDGERFYREHRVEGCEFYIFIGLGLGYHLGSFVSDGGVKKVVILEPVEELFKVVKDFDDVRELIENRKVDIYTGSEIQLFLQNINRHYDYLFYNKIQVLSYRPLRNLFTSHYKILEEGIRDELNNLINDGLTIGKFARRWIENFSVNIKKVNRIQTVSSLYENFKGEALVTGAGPSLDRNIQDIRKKRDFFFLIASDASVKPLLKQGVRPDLIVTIDPQSHALYHFAELDRNVIESIPAVLSLLTPPPVFEIFKKRYIYFTLHPTTFLFKREFLNEEDAILNYRSVTSLALKVAIHMGFEKIYLTGVDLSYPELRVYAKNTFFYDYAIKRGMRFYPFYNFEAKMLRKGEMKIDGLYTSSNLMDYLREIEAITQESEKSRKLEILNWNSLGIRIKGTLCIEKPSFKKSGQYNGYFERMNERKNQIPLKVRDLLPREVLENLLITLALRNRIYRHINNRENAFKAAKEYLKHFEF